MMTSTLATVLGTAVILLLQAIVVGGLIYIALRFAKRRSAGGMQKPIRTGTDGGKVILVIAAFAGVKGLPWWFKLASNKAHPSLVIRYRMIRKYDRRFDQIA